MVKGTSPVKEVNMENIIIAIVLIVLVGSASFYIWKEKKRGNKCIGCPMAANGSCPRHCGGEAKTER